MELCDLITFSAVARCCGITRAAGELNTVQSNVTNRIRALEAEIGVALFERHSRGMTLTGAGRRLLPYAERMVAMSREAVSAARDDGVPRGPLVIGSMETTTAVRLPPLLADFHARFPLVQLSLRTGPTAELITAVLNGALDGAFVAGPIQHPDLVVAAAFKEELVLVTARRWTSLAALRAGTAESGPTALVFRTGCAYRHRLEQVLAAFGWPCSTRFEFGTLDGIIGCVAANIGVTLLPRAVVERSELSRKVRAHTLGSSQKWVETLFIRRRVEHEDSALQSFAACLTKSAMTLDAKPRRAENQTRGSGHARSAIPLQTAPMSEKKHQRPRIRHDRLAVLHRG
jgi:LysR family transcriptional regulator, cell division regulator